MSQPTGGRLKRLLKRVPGQVLADRMHRPSLRAKLLIGAVLLGTLPLIVASIILPMRVQSTLTAVGHEHLIQMARDLANMTQNDIQQHVETVRCLAGVESLQDTLRHYNAGTLTPVERTTANRQFGSLLRGLAANQYQSMFLCGADGVTFAGALKTGTTDPDANFDIRDRAYFIQARDSLQPVVSDPIRSKIGQVPVIVVAMPLVDAHGMFAGLLGVSIEIEHLATFISGQKIGRTGYPYAIDRQGLVLAHPDPQRMLHLDLRRVPGATHLAQRMLNGETGVENYVSSKGESKVAAFAPVPICGWSIAASIETAEFGAPARHLRRIIFAMIAACVVIALAIAIAFAMGLEELNTALAEAQASEARFKLFASVANETIWDWNVYTNDLWWNEGLTTAFGYAPGEVGKNHLDFNRLIPPADREPVLDGIRRCVNGGSWTGEHHVLRKDGTLAYVLHRAIAVQDTDGRTVRVIGGMTDISPRRAAEQKLAEQAALLDQTRDGILVLNLNKVIQFWNRGAERLYGWTSAEAVGRRLDELLRINDPKFEEAAQLVLKNGEWFGHLLKTSKSGAVLTLDCRWTLLCDEKGQPKSILTIDTDITERKQMEAKFLRGQRLESIGTLAGGIAHDLNNLLSPIVMGVDMLRQSTPSEEDRKVIQYIEQSATRAANLVKQVLSFAQGIEGVFVSVHIGYVAREVEAIARSTFPKDITLRVDIAKDLWLVMADPTQINQILLNLCVNARDAMPGGGQLTIRAKNVQLDERFVMMNREASPGPYVVIEVADTGTGMTKEVLERLFEPFFTTKAPGKGTGLGLSTVIGISRSHGGTVNVYSEPGKGSVFKVYLPAAVDSRDGPDDSTPAGTPPDGQGELILLVDDETVILSVTKQVLESFGYKVLIATDGAQAFALYHQHREQIALVLTDMMMPVMDGAALIAALRHIDPNVLVVAASGLHDNNNQIKAAEAGIKHFLCKPYTTETLFSTISSALAGCSTNPERA